MQFNRFSLLAVGGLLVLLLGTPAYCRAGDTIRINGSGSALDMMKPLIAAFLKSNKDTRIVMEKPLGSSGAIKALTAGALDLVLSSRQLKPEETAKGVRQQYYGKTPLVIIAERNVRKTSVTSRELEDIYAGKLAVWPGGEAIRLVLRPREDVDSKIMESLSPAMALALDAARTRPGLVTAVTDPEAYATVAKTPGGLGAIGLTSIITEKIPVISLTLNGVTASPKSLASGAYPLAKEISIITSAKTPAAAQKLISFMLSPQGRAIAAKTGVLVSAGDAARK